MAGWRWNRKPDGWESAPDVPEPVPDEVPAMRASALFDMHDRRAKALVLIEAGLTAGLSRAARDVLLDVRNALLPPDPLEAEPLPLRPSVPVIPGRTP